MCCDLCYNIFSLGRPSRVLHHGGFSIEEGYAQNNTRALTRNASDNAFSGAKKQIFQSGRGERQKIMLLSDGDGQAEEEGPNELIAGLLRREGIQMVDSTLESNCGDISN